MTTTIDEIVEDKKVRRKNLELKDRMLDGENVLISYTINLTREEQRKYARIGIFCYKQDELHYKALYPQYSD